MTLHARVVEALELHASNERLSSFCTRGLLRELQDKAIVPKAPTLAMKRAGIRGWDKGDAFTPTNRRAGDCYRAMLEASDE